MCITNNVTGNGQKKLYTETAFKQLMLDKTFIGSDDRISILERFAGKSIFVTKYCEADINSLFASVQPKKYDLIILEISGNHRLGQIQEFMEFVSKNSSTDLEFIMGITPLREPHITCTCVELA